VELKPAHQVLVEMADEACKDLKALKTSMDSGSFTDPKEWMELQLILAQRTGLLVGLMHALDKMIIPEAVLGSVVAALNKLDYVHAAIFVAARTLDERRRQIATNTSEPSPVEINTAHSSRAFEAARPWNPATRSPAQ